MLLPLLLALASDPAVAPEPPAPSPPATIESLASIDPVQHRRLCELDGLQHASVAPAPGVTVQQTYAGPVVIRPQDPPIRSNDLLYRQGDSLRLYRTLERRIGGCPAPLFVEVSNFAPDED